MEASPAPPRRLRICGFDVPSEAEYSHPAPASQRGAPSGGEAGGEGAAHPRAEPAAAAPRLLDKGDETHPARARRPKLTRAQLRAREAIQYRLATWHRQGYRAFFLTLTSAPASLPGAINHHFQVLRWRIAAYLRIPRNSLEYVRVTTREGHGVIHSVIGVPASALPRPTILLPFELLQAWWTQIHGAFMVNVKAIRSGATDRRKVSSYIVAQYLANQEGAYLRLSQSRCSVDWRTLRDQFRAHAWPNRWDIVSRRNRLPASGDLGLIALRIAAWKKWSWRLYRDALRNLLSDGVAILWGYSYVITPDSTVEAHTLSLLSGKAG